MRKNLHLARRIGVLSPYGHLMTVFMTPTVCLETVAKRYVPLGGGNDISMRSQWPRTQDAEFPCGLYIGTSRSDWMSRALGTQDFLAAFISAHQGATGCHAHSGRRISLRPLYRHIKERLDVMRPECAANGRAHDHYLATWRT